MKKFFRHTFFPAVIYALMAFGLVSLASCGEKDKLTDVIENAWSDIEDDIETSATETLEELADNPEKLYKGDCETDYMPLGDIFTLRIPIDYKAYAAVGLIFGSDAAEFLSLMDSSNRNSKSKSDIKKLILKHFNPVWSEMMTALIILDGEFDYDFENDDWMDASTDFDAKELYRILNDKGYFNGAYGDPLPSADSVATAANVPGNTGSRQVPITIESPNAFGGYQHEFNGKINNKYAVNMHLDLENYTGHYYYVSSSGGNLDLEIVSFDPDSRAIQIVETNDSGEQTGFFDGYLTRDGKFYGTFTNYKGVEMPFRLDVQDAT